MCINFEYDITFRKQVMEKVLMYFVNGSRTLQAKTSLRSTNTLSFLAYYEMSASINCFLESVKQTRSCKNLNNLHYHIVLQNPLGSTFIDYLMLFVTIVELIRKERRFLFTEYN